MGMHTWFYKDKKLYDECIVITNKLDRHDIGIENLSDRELLELNHELDGIEERNDTSYHDLFRLKNKDLADKVLYSKAECTKWMQENKESLYFSDTMFDTPEKIEELKKEKLKSLDEFWESYPNGVIEFL